MIGKGLFHTHLVVGDLEKSLKFYTGLFGMQKIDFEDGTLVFLTTPGRGDLLALNPGGEWDIQEAAPKRTRARRAWPAFRAERLISATCCRAWRSMSGPLPTSLNLADGWWFDATTAACLATLI